jgi:hypothetical protein
MGKPLDTRGGQSPLGRLGFLIGVRSTQTYWGGRCGQEQARWDGSRKSAELTEAREGAPSLTGRLLSCGLFEL